jgi:hypothetical protein
MVIEIIAASLTASPQAKLVVTVQTKNSEDKDGEAVDLSSFPDIIEASAIPMTQFQTEFKELYRYRFAFVQPGADDWVHYRLLSPSWVSN